MSLCTWIPAMLHWVSNLVTKETFWLALSFYAELLVAAVIYYEWEGSRLDTFLHDADSLAEERHRIYGAYCSLNDEGARAKSRAFKVLIEQGDDEKLISACHNNIRLLSRIGARLPARLFWGLRRRPVRWHVVVDMWLILEDFVESRRAEFGVTYAEDFLSYAHASMDEMLKQEREFWVLRDPNRKERRDARFTRRELVEAKARLSSSMKKKG